MALALVVVMLAGIAVVSSTPEGRAASRARLRPYEGRIAIAAVALWAVILSPMLMG